MVVSSAYLKLLIFLPEILIPACDSSSPAFHMVYSAYKLNMQGDNIQPWHIPFPIWNQSIVPCLVLTVAFWPVYRFLRKQMRWSGIPISLRIFHSFLWSNYTRIYNDPDNHNGVITHLEPDILGFEVKWALASITKKKAQKKKKKERKEKKKAQGGDEFPVELFQTLKDDAVKELHSVCQQFFFNSYC